MFKDPSASLAILGHTIYTNYCLIYHTVNNGKHGYILMYMYYFPYKQVALCNLHEGRLRAFSLNTGKSQAYTKYDPVGSFKLLVKT